MKLTIVDHPLIQDKLTRMRDKNTPPMEFRMLLQQLTQMLLFEVTRDFPLKAVPVETPVAPTIGYRFAVSSITVVPILRAGMGFLQSVLELLPEARTGTVGLYRDEKTLKPVEYYCKIPSDKEAEVIIVDPMLATGGSADACITMLKEQGYKHIRFMCLVAAPMGVSVVNKAHPDVPIYAAALDDSLNDKGYIVPGLGDAGDRIFGTL